MTPAKIISHECCEVLKNTYLRTAAFESVRYQVYILLSKCYLEEGKKYSIDVTPECFDKSFVLVNENITKYINYKYE